MFFNIYTYTSLDNESLKANSTSTLGGGRKREGKMRMSVKNASTPSGGQRPREQ